MKDWSSWGIRIRDIKDHNYHAVWNNLKIIRTGLKEIKELSYLYSEFYDIGLGTKCITGKCPFCYTSASSEGKDNLDVVGSWRYFMKHYKKDVPSGENMIITDKPFQVALGSTSEPTEHPEFCDLLEEIWLYQVVPNYTTNGVIISSIYDKNSEWYNLSKKILEKTSEYVGGVAVSFGNKHLSEQSSLAVKALIEYGDTNINIHHIITPDKKSIDDFLISYERFGDDIKYHVLLPQVFGGRSTESFSLKNYKLFEKLIDEILKRNIKNIAFGANFYKLLKKQTKIQLWDYPPEILSKNIILGNGGYIITKNSFNLNPIFKARYGKQI